MGDAAILLERMSYKASADQQTPGWALAQAGAVKYKQGEVASSAQAQADLYTQLNWIATAIDHVAEHSAGYAYDVKRRDGEQLVDIPNHPFELLLHDPNPRDSRFEFMRDLYAFYKLTGNALIYQSRESEFAPPDEAWIMPSHMVTPVPDGQSYLKGYIFDAGNGSKVALEPWEVCHIKTFNPLNPFWGLSAVQQLAVVARGDLAQQMWNTNLFDKDNAKVPGALAFKSMVQNGDWERLKGETRENWGGVNRKGPLMLRGTGAHGVEWVQMAMSQKEMEFLASRKFTKEEIFGKIAPGLASVLDVNATEANAIAGKSILMEFGIWPMLQAVGAKMSKSILPAYGDNLVGEFDDPRQANQILDLKEQQEYSETHTIDEIREEYYGDKPMGDERGDLLIAELKNKGLSQAIIQAGNTPDPNAGSATDTTMVSAAATPAAPATDPNAVPAELKAWERFAVKRLGKTGGRDFEPRALPLFQVARIRTALKAANTREAINKVFDAETPEPSPAIILAALERATAALEREQ